MAESLGVATLELEGDLSGLEKDLAAARGKALAGGKKAAAGFGATFATGVKKATVPAIAALGLLVVGANKAITAASDVEEAQSAVNTTFGKSAAVINEYASSTEDSFSKVDFLSSAKTFAVFGKAAKLSGEDLAHFSSRLVFAAQDMASFHNADPSVVLENLRAGLAGETEPLRKYGILLNDAALKEFAWKKGIAKRGEELTEKQKVLAREGFILENLGDAQGDYARTAESAANVERRQAANAEDLNAKIGKGLLPAYQAFQRILLVVTEFMGQHTDAVRIAAVVIAGLATAVLLARGVMAVYPVVMAAATAAQWLFNAAVAANPVVLIVAAIIALGVALVIAYKKSEKFRAVVGAAIDFVKAHWKSLLLLIPGIGIMLRLIIGNWRTLRDVASAGINKVRGLIDSLKTKLAAVKNFLGTLKDAAKTAFNAMRDKARVAVGPIQRIVDALRSVWNFLTNLTSKIWSIDINLPDPTPGFDVPGVPGFDSGGVVGGPRGAARLIMAHGGETILPTHKPGFRGGGGDMHFHFPRYSGSRRELIADIKRGVDEHRRGNGGREPF